MLVVIPGSDINRHAALMDRVFRFRHAVFVDEKAWVDLRQPDGRERDQFDDENAVHHICLRGDEIVGYQQLLPTTRPHLLTEVLSDLCRERPPTGPRVFEWTRFCAAPGWRDLHPPSGRPLPRACAGCGRMGIGAPCRHSHGRDRLASDGHCHAVAVFRSTARFPEKDRQRRSRRAAHVLQPRDAGHDPPGAWLQRFRAVGDSAPDRGLIPKPSQGADP